MAPTSATLSLRRMVGIELGKCRSGRMGHLWVGNGRERQIAGGQRRHGLLRGYRLPLGDQEAIGGKAEGGMMMKASPTAPFVVAESDLLLQFLVIALEGYALGKIGKPVFRRLAFAFRPFDQRPFLWPAFRQLVIPMGGADPQAGESRGQGFGGAVAPSDGVPGVFGQVNSELSALVTHPVHPIALGVGLRPLDNIGHGHYEGASAPAFSLADGRGLCQAARRSLVRRGSRPRAGSELCVFA